MIKIISFLCLLGTLIFILLFNTPVTRLGTGFLISTGSYVFTYYDLIKEANFIKIIFPNQDDIDATVLYKDPSHNLVVLKLKTPPKVKPKKLTYSKTDIGQKKESIYTLSYPWTNTMEDKYVVISGTSSLSDKSNLIPIDMNVKSINSGGPLLNVDNELVGMVLFQKHAVDFYKSKKLKAQNYAIPASTLIEVIKQLELNKGEKKPKTYSEGLFTKSIKKNIVLIEAS